MASAERKGDHAGRITISEKVFDTVQVSVEARLGSTQLSMAELMALASGSLLPLDTPVGGLVDILLNGSPIARGEIVAVDDRFAVRIFEIV